MGKYLLSCLLLPLALPRYFPNREMQRHAWNSISGLHVPVCLFQWLKLALLNGTTGKIRFLFVFTLISIGISDKGLFWGRWPLTALNGHLMNLVGPFLALKKKRMLV